MDKCIDFKLKLLSDMCCGNGEGNGIDVDTCAYFSDLGLPEIPGRRFKGLLREKAELLETEGFCPKGTCDILFGSCGGLKSKMQVANLRIENVFEIEKAVATYDPAEVRKAFVTKRVQTAINKAGVAIDNSLRTIETVTKGTVFDGKIRLTDASEEELAVIETALKLLRNIGLNKNRGFGEVSIYDIKKTEDSIREYSYQKAGQEVKLEYRITLLSDLVLFGNSSMQTPDYIPGTSVMGAFAGMLQSIESFDTLFFDDLCFENAYIHGAQPIPLSVVMQKNSKNETIFNLADGYEKKDAVQYVPVNGYYSADDREYAKYETDSGLEYHINRHNEDLYLLHTLKKGQTFIGVIYASESAAELLQKVVSDRNGRITIGASSGAQYGQCYIELSKTFEKEIARKGDDVIVELISDAIILDEYGNNTVDPQYLVNEIKETLGFDCVDTHVYSKTATVGGYNAKWGMPKRQYEAFVKGTTVVLKGCTEKNVAEYFRIGLETNSGYGYIHIRNASSTELSKKVAAWDAWDAESTTYGDFVVQKIRENQAILYIKDEAMSAAETLAHNESKSAAMRVLTKFFELEKGNDLLREYKENTAMDKEPLYHKILETFEKAKAGIENEFDIQKLFKIYLRTFIDVYKYNAGKE